MFLRRFPALIVLALFIGWNHARPAVQAGFNKAASASRPASSPRLSDSQIETAIKAKLAKSKIGADGFSVRVRNGVATWEGKTNVIQHKGAATRMARTAGAVSVVNNIQISEAARLKAAERLAQSRSGNAPIKRASVVK